MCVGPVLFLCLCVCVCVCVCVCTYFFWGMIVLDVQKFFIHCIAAGQSRNFAQAETIGGACWASWGERRLY